MNFYFLKKGGLILPVTNLKFSNTIVVTWTDKISQKFATLILGLFYGIGGHIDIHNTVTINSYILLSMDKKRRYVVQLLKLEIYNLNSCLCNYAFFFQAQLPEHSRIILV